MKPTYAFSSVTTYKVGDVYPVDNTLGATDFTETDITVRALVSNSAASGSFSARLLQSEVRQHVGKVQVAPRQDRCPREDMEQHINGLVAEPDELCRVVCDGRLRRVV